MASTNRGEAALIAALNDLIQLDHDAVEGYTIAIDRIRDATRRETLVDFRADHKRHIEELAALGHDVVDLGTDTDVVRIDYPVKAREVGKAILGGEADRGVLVCGSGVGASVAACKLPGIRAAICHDVYSAHQGVEHDDMNILTLGSRVIGPEPAFECAVAFLAATFSGEPRHQRRLDKVLRLEAGRG